MIQLQHVTRTFNKLKAVDDISLNIAEGETVVLLGTSGCGKTTTLRMVNRLIDATSGTICVNGEDIQTQPVEQLRRGIGYVLQHHGLFPHYTVAENIAIVPKLLKWEKARINNRVQELLAKLKLPPEVAHMLPQQLSGGQQQRVGLARALAADPPVLLMDEPFGALDTITRSEVRREFKSLDELRRKTILMVTHDVREAIELGDRICIMDKGKIVQAGTARELLINPANEFVSSFLKDDRLRFALESTTIKDVWHFLPSTDHPSAVCSLEADVNLWQALETLSLTRQSGDIVCTATYQSQSKIVNTSSLMAAFSNSQNTVSNG